MLVHSSRETSRERAPFLPLGTSENLENVFPPEVHTRRSSDTSYLYDQEFRATSPCFPGKKFGLSLSKGSFVQGKGRIVGFVQGGGRNSLSRFLMTFLNERNETCSVGDRSCEQSSVLVRGYRIFTSIHPPFHYEIPPIEIKEKGKGIYMELFFFYLLKNIHLLKCSRNGLEIAFIFYK